MQKEFEEYLKGYYETYKSTLDHNAEVSAKAALQVQASKQKVGSALQSLGTSIKAIGMIVAS